MSLQAKLTYASPDDPLAKRLFIRSVETLTGQRKLARIYDNVLAEQDHRDIWGAALRELQVVANYDDKQLAKAPADGPVIIIANHPYGVLDGLIICHLAAQIRPEFKILIHNGLCREPRVERFMLPIDFSETAAATQLNIATKQRALATLQAGNAVVIFPAGGIATTVHGPFGHAVDLEWKLFVAKLIQMTQATVIPIYFHGQNSRVFQLASHLSLTLRLALIIHEVNRKRGDTINVSIGDPIPYQDLAPIRKRKELLCHLREVTYGLSQQRIAHQRPPHLPFDRKKDKGRAAKPAND